MNVRTLEKRDIPIVAEIEPRCFKQPWKEKMFASLFSFPFQYALVLEDEGQVCGYCCYSVLFDEAEILNIAVDIPHRRKGFGTVILQNALSSARAMGAKICFLEVRVSNASAIGLYEKFGFEKFGVRKKYYEDSEDAAVMRKQL